MKSWLKAVAPPTWSRPRPSSGAGVGAQPVDQRLGLGALRVVPRHHRDQRGAAVARRLRPGHPSHLGVAPQLARVGAERRAVRGIGRAPAAQLGDHLRRARWRPARCAARPARRPRASRGPRGTGAARRCRSRATAPGRRARAAPRPWRWPRPTGARMTAAVQRSQKPRRSRSRRGARPAAPRAHHAPAAREHREPPARVGAAAEQAHQHRQQGHRREDRDRHDDDRAHRHRADRGRVDEEEARPARASR